MHSGSPWARRLATCAADTAAALLFLLLAAFAHPAVATDLSVYPIRIELRPERAAETVQLSSREDQPLRFEVSYQAWTMDEGGQWHYADSEDLLVHPLLLTVPANGSATLRVGSLLPPPSEQHAWRLFIQQLPQEQPDSSEGVQLQMLTRLSIPVFFGMGTERAQPRIAHARVQGDVLHLDLANDGGGYLAPGALKLSLRDAGGQPLAPIESAVGYILAQRRLPLQVPLPAGACRRVQAVSAEFADPHVTAEAAIEAGDRGCGG